jgi:hypothetical protein
MFGLYNNKKKNIPLFLTLRQTALSFFFLSFLLYKKKNSKEKKREEEEREKNVACFICWIFLRDSGRFNCGIFFNTYCFCGNADKDSLVYEWKL